MVKQVEYEIIFEKSRKNLKKIYNRIKSPNETAWMLGQEKTLVVAIGGYNKTYELLKSMGLKDDRLLIDSNLLLTPGFIERSHMKRVILVKKINYITKAQKTENFTKRTLELNIADGFEEQLMVYQYAKRQTKKGEQWVKPSIIVLDDQSLNLQFDGHRFFYFDEIGFVQMRNRNADPFKIIAELQGVEEADKMMFALYQDRGADEASVLDALQRLKIKQERIIGSETYFKPTEYKRILGSNLLANTLKNIPELGIHQLKSNKKIGKENARWVIVPDQAFEFQGFNYMDEEDLYNQEILDEEEAEREEEDKQMSQLRKLLDTKIRVNFIAGYVGSVMPIQTEITIDQFIRDIDDLQESQGGIKLLKDAKTDEEYNRIKREDLPYFLDGSFKDNKRNDHSYLGGKRLVSIDIDDGDYTREQLEERLDQQGLFGIVYPTPKYYFNKSNRWRIILLADRDMTKEEYKDVVEGVANMLNLSIDQASKKLSQLMGYPLSNKDTSLVVGSMINVNQFKKIKFIPQATETKIESDKSILDFNHDQARLLKEVLRRPAPEGERNETYYQVANYLADTIEKPEFSQKQKDEARSLIPKLIDSAYASGMTEREVNSSCRRIV